MQPKTQRRTQECFVLFFTVLFSSVFSCVCAYFVYFCVFSCVFQYIAFHLIVCIPLHHCAMSTRFRNAFQPIVFHYNSHCFCITIHIVFALQFTLFLHYIPMQHLTREKGEQARRGARGLRGGTNSYQGGVGAFCIRSHHC